MRVITGDRFKIVNPVPWERRIERIGRINDNNVNLLHSTLFRRREGLRKKRCGAVVMRSLGIE